MSKLFTFFILITFFCLSSYSKDDIPSFAVENALSRKPFLIDTLRTQHIYVYTEKDFIVKSSVKSVVFELKNNIIVNSTIKFKGQKSYYIKGNGFSIKEKDHLKPILSLPYKAESWSLDREGEQMTIKLRDSLFFFSKNRDSIYIVYESWFRRFKDKVLSISDSTIVFKCNEKFLSNKKFQSLTPSPFFYLEEKPALENKLYRLFDIGHNTCMLIDDLIFDCSSICCIANYGDLKIRNCVFKNIEGKGIWSKGNLFVERTFFHGFTSYPIEAQAQSYLDVTYSKFEDIGMRGDNIACISAKGDAYIANNMFLNYNYCAIKLGRRSCNIYPSSVVENNILVWTPDWERKMEVYGLTDGGAIYISTCNKRAIVRYNTILKFGGHKANRAIYCDDGAFNVTIYGNVISGTRNSYDIDSRDCSKKWKKQGRDSVHCPNTGNYIGYNICDGKLKLEGASAIPNNGCVFENNIILGRNTNTKDIVNGNSQCDKAIIYDCDGYIDNKGEVFIKKFKKKTNVYAPTL